MIEEEKEFEETFEEEIVHEESDSEIIIKEEEIEENKNENIPSYFTQKYSFEKLNLMDTFDLMDLFDDKITTNNTKALIIQVLAKREIYID